MKRITFLPKQLVFLEDERKVASARGGVGSGKTQSLCWWFIREQSKYPLAMFGVIGATFTQLERGFFRSLRGICDKHKIRYTYTTSPRPKFVFSKTGAVVESLSAEQREQLRSLEMDRVVVEEPQTWDGGKETFLTLVERLRPSPAAVAHYPGISPQIRLTFNPPIVGHWLYELFEKQWRGVYPCYRMSLRENTILHRIDPTYLPFLLRTIQSERQPREIDGEWGTIATGVYRGFDAEKHTIEALMRRNPQKPIPDPFPPFGVDLNAPIDWALDFNVEWAGSVVTQWHSQPMVVDEDPETGEKIRRPMVRGWQEHVCYALEEIFLHDVGTPNVVAEFIHRFGDVARQIAKNTGGPGVRLYGDPAGGARAQAIDAQSSARSNWKIVQRDLTAEKIPFEYHVDRKAPSVMDRINAVRDQFEVNGDVGYIGSLEANPELCNDYNMVQFVPGKNEIDKSDRSEDGLKRTHLSDAIGYEIYRKRRPRDAGASFAFGKRRR